MRRNEDANRITKAGNKKIWKKINRSPLGVRGIIAITMGDPASIGPEIAVKALQKEEIHATCKPLLVGDAKVFEQIIAKLKLTVKVNAIDKVSRCKI